MEHDMQPVIYKPLKRRFYILFGFCMYSFVNGLIWNSWQPILKSLNELFHWNVGQVNLINNINALTYCVFLIPFIILWNKYGIKFSYLTSSAIVLIGCLLRLFPCGYAIQSILIQIGNAISSYGNLMYYIGALVISATWFPTNERARSTCTSLAFSTFGCVMAPITASLLVPVYGNDTSPSTIASIELGLQKFMFLHCALAMIGLTLIIIYFPSKPKYFPCKSAERCLRIDIKSGFLTLIRNSQFWLVFILNFITSGLNSGVIYVIPSLLITIGVDQKNSALLNAFGNLSVFIGSIVGGFLGDKFSYKKIVVYTAIPSIFMYLIYGLQISKIIRHELELIYIVVIIMLIISNIAINLSFEMGCEVAFPTGEEITTSLLGFSTNLGTVVFLTITVITNDNVKWIPYFYAGCIVLTLPLMYFYKDERKRYNCDFGIPESKLIQVVDESNEENAENAENQSQEETLDHCSLLRFPY